MCVAKRGTFRSRVVVVLSGCRIRALYLRARQQFALHLNIIKKLSNKINVLFKHE